MSGSIRIRTERNGTTAMVRLLITHPMVIGSRGADQPVVVSHYITEVIVERGDETVLRADWGPGIAKNPFLLFRLQNTHPGDLLRIRWRDNRGATDELESILA